MQEEQLKIDGEIDRLEKVKKAIKGGWLDVSLAKRAIRESHDLDSILSAARSLVTAAEKLEIVFKKLEETK